MADPIAFVPASCAEGVGRGREILSGLLERARAADPVTLVALADEIRLAMRRGEREAGGHLRSCSLDIVAALDRVYDDAFPVRDPADVAGLLDVAWPSASRRELLLTAVGSHMRLDEVTRQALAGGDVRLLRIVLHTPFGHRPRHTVARILDALHAAGALDAAAVTRAFTEDRHVWRDIAGLSCAAAVRDHVDALVRRLIATPAPADFPEAPPPRGLAFVRAALERADDPDGTGYLGAAELTVAEQQDLVESLRHRPDSDRNGSGSGGSRPATTRRSCRSSTWRRARRCCA